MPASRRLRTPVRVVIRTSSPTVRPPRAARSASTTASPAAGGCPARSRYGVSAADDQPWPITGAASAPRTGPAAVASSTGKAASGTARATPGSAASRAARSSGSVPAPLSRSVFVLVFVLVLPFLCFSLVVVRVTSRAPETTAVAAANRSAGGVAVSTEKSSRPAPASRATASSAARKVPR
ncbi:hypothetical protein B0E53_03950 [Micromonospora sp. MH33]|nr:hypothetical protein B0E53_03950 [Micromonospora sp. MH33]